MMGNARNNSGFTIIEISLSMAMLSVLMLILLLSSMQIVSIYSRGITLKRVNQSALSVGTEIQNALRQGKPGEVKIRQNNGVATGLCTGNARYVWSSYDKNGVKGQVKYSDGSQVFFAKVTKGDPCDPASTIAKIDSTELLADGLVIRDPTSVQFVQSAGNRDALVSFTYTLSTDDTTNFILDTSGRSTCAPGDGNDFCALNTFTITAYVRGGV